jgi:hypothetical protein
VRAGDQSVHAQADQDEDDRSGDTGDQQARPRLRGAASAKSVDMAEGVLSQQIRQRVCHVGAGV